MQAAPSHNRWLIALTFLLGLVLSVVPMPQDMSWLRPQVVVVIFIYWCLVLPHLVGVISAWLVGIALDVVTHSVLGQHALALVVVAYICLLSYQRIRSYLFWQQSMWVFIMVGIHQLFVNWVHSLGGHSAPPSRFLLPALSSALLWPLVYTLLERLRIKYRIS
ncbi:rod shape-determining protein MreD [Halioxenophilus sp. WMMB6]|uniref:rod shape-determining protein MreD n=1 Tax=Halioxenophilus sp. WMMB6 TaxID=3073815 RepID=UPI00295ED154|nr:rod shape-determining protein MreD [Halioxenophilus sp. WMMB6]